MAILESDDTWVAQPLHLALLAELHAQAGEIERGLAVLSEGIAVADAHGEHWYTAELHHTHGRLLMLAQDDVAAEHVFQRAIAVAPEDLNGFFAFLTVPPAAPFPEALWLKQVVA